TICCPVFQKGWNAERPDPKLLQAHLIVLILEETTFQQCRLTDGLPEMDAILNAGVQEVYLCGITERGTFPRNLDFTHRSFNTQRKKINGIFRESGRYLCAKKIRFPKHYSKDLVDLNEIAWNYFPHSCCYVLN
ncbi:hypothetical protein MAR_032957, partial [Mya arenaria]